MTSQSPLTLNYPKPFPVYLITTLALSVMCCNATEPSATQNVTDVNGTIDYAKTVENAESTNTNSVNSSVVDDESFFVSCNDSIQSSSDDLKSNSKNEVSNSANNSCLFFSVTCFTASNASSNNNVSTVVDIKDRRAKTHSAKNVANNLRNSSSRDLFLKKCNKESSGDIDGLNKRITLLNANNSSEVSKTTKWVFSSPGNNTSLVFFKNIENDENYTSSVFDDSDSKDEDIQSNQISLKPTLNLKSNFTYLDLYISNLMNVSAEDSNALEKNKVNLHFKSSKLNSTLPEENLLSESIEISQGNIDVNLNNLSKTNSIFNLNSSSNIQISTENKTAHASYKPPAPRTPKNLFNNNETDTLFLSRNHNYSILEATDGVDQNFVKNFSSEASKNISNYFRITTEKDSSEPIVYTKNASYINNDTETNYKNFPRRINRILKSTQNMSEANITEEINHEFTGPTLLISETFNNSQTSFSNFPSRIDKNIHVASTKVADVKFANSSNLVSKFSNNSEYATNETQTFPSRAFKVSNLNSRISTTLNTSASVDSDALQANNSTVLSHSQFPIRILKNSNSTIYYPKVDKSLPSNESENISISSASDVSRITESMSKADDTSKNTATIFTETSNESLENKQIKVNKTNASIVENDKLNSVLPPNFRSRHDTIENNQPKITNSTLGVGDEFGKNNNTINEASLVDVDIKSVDLNLPKLFPNATVDEITKLDSQNSTLPISRYRYDETVRNKNTQNPVKGANAVPSPSRREQNSTTENCVPNFYNITDSDSKILSVENGNTKSARREHFGRIDVKYYFSKEKNPNKKHILKIQNDTDNLAEYGESSFENSNETFNFGKTTRRYGMNAVEIDKHTNNVTEIVNKTNEPNKRSDNSKSDINVLGSEIITILPNVLKQNLNDTINYKSMTPKVPFPLKNHNLTATGIKQKLNCTTIVSNPVNAFATSNSTISKQNLNTKTMNDQTIVPTLNNNTADYDYAVEISNPITVEPTIENNKALKIRGSTNAHHNNRRYIKDSGKHRRYFNSGVGKTARDELLLPRSASTRRIIGGSLGHQKQTNRVSGDVRQKTVTLLGLFELTTKYGDRPEGHAELAAARLAVKHINDRKLLPGYILDLITNDTKCDPGVGVDRFFHALYTQRDTRMIMLLGSACSEVTESLAKVVPYWNLVQVSFGSTSPALSDRSEFPLFYRTVAPDSSHNGARLAFVRRWGWDAVAALSQNEDVFSLAVNDLVTELEAANITCTATVTFAASDFKEQMQLLKDLDTRIIIGSFSAEMAPKIFCEAHQLGMYGSDYAWILPGGPTDIWWINSSDCAQNQLFEATEGLILVSSHNSIVGTDPSYSGLTNEMFVTEIERNEAVTVMSPYASQTYDAVWSIALALKGAEQHWKNLNIIPQMEEEVEEEVLSDDGLQSQLISEEKRFASVNTVMENDIEMITIGQFDYTRKDMTDVFLNQLAQLNFSGISGPVSFSGADRVGTSAFHQIQGGSLVQVALYYPNTSNITTTGVLDFTCRGCTPVRWGGDVDKGQVPIARRVFRLRVVTITPAAFLIVTSLASIGIALAITFLAFNLHFRKIKPIKLSSPRLSNIAAVGCILVYAAVVSLGLDNATLNDNQHFSTVCTVRVYLLSAGFSLAFGSMFTKTYRVHHIFTRSRSGVVKNRLLQDTQLISLICMLLLIDGLIVTLWVVVDPMERHLHNLSLEISAEDRSVVYQPQVEVCRSQNTNGWLGALYVYKGLLLIVGVYMAWETRHVKIPALNDSQYIGVSVYSVVITSAIVVVIANLISERATLAFVTISTMILISTTSTLCLLFIPKLYAIFGQSDGVDPVVESMGLKIEYNTRRFVTDDRRELQYRVEVQNRVYRREVAALDLEIGRLEKLLSEPSSGSDSASTSSAADGLKKADICIVDEISTAASPNEIHPRAPSIGGGLPLLLLSVLPPVIPRASWPSADHCSLPMRRSVTFSSEPKLEDSKSSTSRNLPAIDLLNLRLRHNYSMDSCGGKPGVIERLKNFFGSKQSIRKTSTASFSGNSSVGIAAALKVHMGYIAGLMPGTNKTHMASSCNTSSMNIHQLGTASNSRETMKRHSCAQMFSSGPTIHIPSERSLTDANEDGKENFINRKFSVALCLQKRNSRSSEICDNSATGGPITHQRSQPVLSFKERAKGSPRFPHRIVPASCSLAALEDRRKSSTFAAKSKNSLVVDNRRSSQQSNKNKISNSELSTKWKSMDDTTFNQLPRNRRGSGPPTTSCIPLTVGHDPRLAKYYNPNCDVWATAEFGTPLSELKM